MARDWPPSSPFERQKEKRSEREREEIWREKEEELAGPLFFLSPLFLSPLPLSGSPLLFQSPSSGLQGESGRSEVNRK